MKILTRGVIIILVVLGGFLLYRNLTSEQFDLPKGDTVPVFLEEDTEDAEDVVDTEDAEDPLTTGDTGVAEDKDKDMPKLSTRQIFETDGVRHSVSLNEIVGGGPPKDGIPSIDSPKFVSVDEADKFLSDTEPGTAFSRGSTHRFYPYQITVWHEIVNDIVEGERILVTYCPLCLTGYILDPVVKGERVEFGTSGKLWRSNLVMYDRKTDSLWSQVLGEAILGEMTGTVLDVLPSDQILYGNWKKAHPNGEVLSRDTGSFRRYGSSPYGDYFAVTNLSLQLAKPTDTRLPNGAFVFGIVENGKAKAYSVDSVKAKGEVEDVFEGTTFVLQYDKDLDVVRMFKKLQDGTMERFNPISGFWFSWAVAHPDTELYK